MPRGWTPVARIPNAPPQLVGVLNLRGAIVPVLDLGLSLGLVGATYGAETVVIIVQLVADSGAERLAGLVVDDISDVLTVSDRQSVATPDSATQVPLRHVKGLVRDKGDTVILLVLSTLLDFDDY